MAKTVTVNLGKLFDRFAERIVSKVLDEAYLEIQKKSPVDTGLYISQHKKLPIRVED